MNERVTSAPLLCYSRRRKDHFGLHFRFVFSNTTRKNPENKRVATSKQQWIMIAARSLLLGAAIKFLASEPKRAFRGDSRTLNIATESTSLMTPESFFLTAVKMSDFDNFVVRCVFVHYIRKSYQPTLVTRELSRRLVSLLYSKS